MIADHRPACFFSRENFNWHVDGSQIFLWPAWTFMFVVRAINFQFIYATISIFVFFVSHYLVFFIWFIRGLWNSLLSVYSVHFMSRSSYFSYTLYPVRVRVTFHISNHTSHSISLRKYFISYILYPTFHIPHLIFPHIPHSTSYISYSIAILVSCHFYSVFYTSSHSRPFNKKNVTRYSQNIHNNLQS